MIWRWIKRQFTHPYGACAEEGCDNPTKRWMALCEMHRRERIRQAARDQARAEFDRQADVIAEGIRRARLHTEPDEDRDPDWMNP